jgi:hypothetical protein
MLKVSAFHHKSFGKKSHGILSAVIVASALCLSPAAMAKTEKGKVSGSIQGGTEFSIDGDVHTGVNAPVADLGPLNPALAGVSAELRIEKKSQNKIYGESYNIGGELAYGLSDNSEVFGSYRYNYTGRGTAQVGNAFVAATNQTLPITGEFGKYKSHNVELGYRQYFGEGALQPYGAVRGGIGFVDKINANFTIPAANIAINNARFYKKSTVFTGGADLGVSYDVGTNVSIQAEAGLRYASKLNDEDADIGGLGLASINNSGDRLSIPVTLRLKVGF